MHTAARTLKDHLNDKFITHSYAGRCYCALCTPFARRTKFIAASDYCSSSSINTTLFPIAIGRRIHCVHSFVHSCEISFYFVCVRCAGVWSHETTTVVGQTLTFNEPLVLATLRQWNRSDTVDSTLSVLRDSSRRLRIVCFVLPDYNTYRNVQRTLGVGVTTHFRTIAPH